MCYTLTIWLLSFQIAEPVLFRIGDIVEVQTTIVVVPIKRDRFKMILQLRSIALLDGTFAQVR